MEGKIVYFENTGKENTDEVLRIAKQRAEELGIKTIVVASASGNTAAKAAQMLDGCKVVSVSHCTGFREPNVQRFTEENRKIVEDKGGTVFTGLHLFMGVSRAIRNKYNMYGEADIVADTLKIFGSGTKVACEIAMMAADSGLVRTDEDVISIGGTSKGADTALVMTPVNCSQLFDLKVKEILCKPRFG